MKFHNLMQEGKLGNRKTKNRIILSPMGDNMSHSNGELSEHAISYYTERAKGGTGVIITGFVCVDYPRGKGGASQTRLDKMNYINAWERLARDIHRYGALLLPQLHHAGEIASWTDGEAVCSIRIPSESEKEIAGRHYLTTEEIKELENKFITSAKYSQMAGCDGVALHGAHGYLINQFLDARINNRTDEYGGSDENRRRFAVNVITGIRSACGPDFIIGMRMPMHNWDDDGLTDEFCIETAKAYEKAGCDFLDISCGVTAKAGHMVENYYRPQGDRVDAATKIMGHVTIPVSVVGNLRDAEFCEKLIAEGKTDYVTLGRPLIADPYWANKVATGCENEIVQCISCLGACGLVNQNHIGARCIFNPITGYEREYENERYMKQSKKIVIVGAGPAGIQAALTAKELGHEVILLEKKDRIGGQLRLASVPPHKDRIALNVEMYETRLEKKQIDVRLNCEATLAYIKDLAPDHVIVATGSLPWIPNLAGKEYGVFAWDVLNGQVTMPSDKKVVIIGGGLVGCETAELLVERGNKVTILEKLSTFANGIGGAIVPDLQAALGDTEIITSANVIAIKENAVVYSKDDVQNEIAADFVIYAMGQRSVGAELVKGLQENGLDVTVIGDAKRPRKIQDATTEGFFAALNL